MDHGLCRLHRDRLEVARALLEVQYANWPYVIPFYTEDIEYHDPIVDIYGIDMMAQFREIYVFLVLLYSNLQGELKPRKRPLLGLTE
jgi:hypothetical protein